MIERLTARKLLKASTSVASVFVCSFAIIWYGYSTSSLIRGGYYTVHAAIYWTAQMAAVTTILVSTAIALSVIVFRRPTRIGGLLADLCSVGLFLTGYTALNVLWRNSWNPATNRPAFLPLWNNVNSHFFNEWNWLSYLVFVTPFIALISALLCLYLARHHLDLLPNKSSRTTNLA